MVIYILYPKWLGIEKIALFKETAFKILRPFVYSFKQDHHINNTLLFPISPSLPNTTAFKITAQKIHPYLIHAHTHTDRHTQRSMVIGLVEKKLKKHQLDLKKERSSSTQYRKQQNPPVKQCLCHSAGFNL